jgi:hypothetical protein
MVAVAGNGETQHRAINSGGLKHQVLETATGIVPDADWVSLPSCEERRANLFRLMMTGNFGQIFPTLRNDAKAAAWGRIPPNGIRGKS